jgi:uncharacterized protein (TIGR03083 family)
MVVSETNSDPTSGWMSALRGSQQRLAAMVTPMSAAAVESPSYDSEWSIAQVMSHLGSGAEIFALFIDAGLTGSPSPAFEQFQPIWDTWNSKSPNDQAQDGLRADATFVEQLDGLDEAQQASWQLEMFGGEQRLADVIRLRLGEHTLHSWDVAVMGDPDATLAPDAVALLIDHMGQLVARAGKTPAKPIGVVFETADPARSLRLDATGEALSLTAQEPGTRADGDAVVRLPAEALIRLFYGRLDPDHTPSIETDGIDLDTLRTMFPGV